MRFAPQSKLLNPALAVAWLVIPVSAQGGGGGGNNLPDLSSAAKSASSAETRSTADQTTRTTDGNTRTATSAKTTATASGSSEDTNQPTRGGETTTAVITGNGQTNTITNSIPSITGGDAATTGGALPSGLPTLSGAFKIVPASVPPTTNAPYMQTSALPEGTVFIAVGAILGFLAMSVLLWRGLVAWSLHRSVKRAAQHQTMTDTKALFGKPAAPFYKYSDRESTISLSGLGGKGNKKTARPTTAPGTASASSLFFSPTAGAAMQNPGNRGSNYLPAGYYAAGASAPGNAQSHISIGQNHGPSISLSNLGAQAQGYSRARSVGPSPPGSPMLSEEHGHGMQSSSTLHLNRGYGGDERAPSAYLEELFDGDGTQPPASSHHHGHRATPSGRF